MGILTVGGIKGECSRGPCEPLAHCKEDEAGRSSSRKHSFRRHAAGGGDMGNQSLAAGGRRRADRPLQTLAQYLQYFRRRREPGIQNIRVDDVVYPLEMIEIPADGIKKCAAVIRGSLLPARNVEPPVDSLAEPVHQTGVPAKQPTEVGHIPSEQFELQRPGLRSLAGRAQPRLHVYVEQVHSPDGDNVSTAPLLHPPECRVRERRCDQSSPVWFGNGEYSQLVEPIVEWHGNLAPREILVNGV